MKINIVNNTGNIVVAPIIINQPNAKKIITDATEIITQIPTLLEHGSVVEDVTLQFCRIDKDSQCNILQSTDYVIVPQITKKQHVKVLYSDEIKSQIVNTTTNPFASIFVCNVEVLMHGDKVAFYKITELKGSTQQTDSDSLLLL